MSQKRAMGEIKRFLARPDPEVLSITGRWGVGKTYAWEKVLRSMRGTIAMRRYAYVSAFGIRSVDALKTAIVQSTVSLDGPELEPTVDSFVEHISTIAGVGRLAERLGRESLDVLGKGIGAVPFVGKMADLLAPGASLLIRRQLICIDDIERAGAGLDVTDILGLVSLLREQRGCKVILFLNREGLRSNTAAFDEYLEKVADRSVVFDPTPGESATAALAVDDPFTEALSARTAALGITNIRVIRRIRHFLSDIEPCLIGLHQGVADRFVQSLALIGWCMWEPGRAPDLALVRKHDRVAGLFSRSERSEAEVMVRAILDAYGFEAFEDVDEAVLLGIEAGAFDATALRLIAEELDARFSDADVRRAIALPWTLLHQGLDDDTDSIVEALRQSIEVHGAFMTADEASDALSLLRELDLDAEAARLVNVYLAAQGGKPREFFVARYGGRREIDPAIAAAFARRLEKMPHRRDVGALLVEIGGKESWNAADVTFLASVGVDDYHAAIKEMTGADLPSAILAALRFGQLTDKEEYGIVAARMTAALWQVSEESSLNRLRVSDYIAEAGR